MLKNLTERTLSHFVEPDLRKKDPDTHSFEGRRQLTELLKKVDDKLEATELHEAQTAN